MTLLTPEIVFRRYETMGAPESGKHEPKKQEIIQLLNMIFGVSRGGWVVARTLAELNSITPEVETDGGVVLTGVGAGYYDRNSGAWVFGRGFPDTFARVVLSGSAAAQTGVVSVGVSPAAIVLFFAAVTTPNTGALTLSIAGEAAKAVVNSAGNSLAPGEWAGSVIFYLNEDGEYQLLVDAGAAASAAQSATNAAASAAAAAAFGTVNFDNISDLLADNNDVVGYAGSGAAIEVAPGFHLGAQGYRYEVAASGATDSHLSTAGGVKLYVLDAHRPEQFDAKGDGSDETEKLQALLNAAGSNVIDGGSAVYTVRSLSINSGQRGKVLRLKTLAGSEDFRAPFTVDGTVTPKADIVFDELYVDGNRQNQSLIIAPGEDGGRHGVRIIGRVRDVHFGILDLSYCGSDGLEVFSYASRNSADDNDFCFANITIGVLRTHWNRRHGSAFDSIKHLKVDAWEASNNGRDLNTSDPLTHGNRGARFGGNLYGRSFDFEDYGIGTNIFDVQVGSFFAEGNVAGALFHSNTNALDPLFVPRRAIHFASFIQTSLQGGVIADNPGLSFENATATASKPGWADVSFDNLWDVGHLYLNGVDRASIRGRPGRAVYRAVISSRCGNDISLDFPRAKLGEVYFDAPPSFTVDGSPINASSINISRAIVDFRKGREVEVLVTYSAGGAGVSSIRLAPTTGWQIRSVIGANGIHNDSGSPVPCYCTSVDSDTKVQVLCASATAGVHAVRLKVLLDPV